MVKGEGALMNPHGQERRGALFNPHGQERRGALINPHGAGEERGPN